jgi:hypothetical protein
LNEVKPIVLLRQSPQGDGFRGAFHRAGHFGPDPLG